MIGSKQFNSKCMHSEKPKISRFRILVPHPPKNSLSRLPAHNAPSQLPLNYALLANQSSTLDTDHRARSLQTEADGYPRKRFIKPGRMRTISSLEQSKQLKNEKYEQKPEGLHCSFKKQQKSNRQQKDDKQLRKLMALVDEFQGRLQKTLEMDRWLYQEKPMDFPVHNEEQYLEEFEVLENETKLRAAKLIEIYLRRYTFEMKGWCLRVLERWSPQEEEDYLISVLPVGPPSGQVRSNRRDRNLLNVRKFFDSK